MLTGTIPKIIHYGQGMVSQSQIPYSLYTSIWLANPALEDSGGCVSTQSGSRHLFQAAHSYFCPGIGVLFCYTANCTRIYGWFLFSSWNYKELLFLP